MGQLIISWDAMSHGMVTSVISTCSVITVFWFRGLNFDCCYCHNWKELKLHEYISRAYSESHSIVLLGLLSLLRITQFQDLYGICERKDECFSV